MDDVRVGATVNRSLVGVMTEFTRQAEAYRARYPKLDLVRLAGWLARVPCGPLYDRHVSPGRELAAVLAGRSRCSQHRMGGRR